MSADPSATPATTPDGGTVACWCCGARDVPDRMVHLGHHPEVHLCLACAHFVHQQAWQIEDHDRRGPGAPVRHRLRGIRAGVIRRGWHRNRFVGPVLRHLGRYLP